MKSYKKIEFPNKDRCGAILKKVFDDPTAQPDSVASLLGYKDRHATPGDTVSAGRSAEYRGHKIEITTTYKIEIDGKPFTGHVAVDDAGRLHCHSIPYATYESAIDCVKGLIDIYPDAFEGKQDKKGGHCHE